MDSQLRAAKSPKIKRKVEIMKSSSEEKKLYITFLLNITTNQVSNGLNLLEGFQCIGTAFDGICKMLNQQSIRGLVQLLHQLINLFFKS